MIGLLDSKTMGVTAMSEQERTPRLRCDVELSLSGPNDATMNKWAADALRDVANRLERGELEDGFVDVKDGVGRKIGTVYVDYSEGTF